MRKVIASEIGATVETILLFLASLEMYVMLVSNSEFKGKFFVRCINIADLDRSIL